MSKNYQIIYPNEIPALIKGAEWISIDTETTGLDFLKDEVVYISFSTAEDNGYLVRVEKFYAEVAQLLTCMTANKIFHNAYFDHYMLSKMGYTLHRVTFDTKIARYVSNMTAKNGLKFLAKKYLNEHPKEFKEVMGTGKQKQTMKEIDVQKILPYACDDSNSTFRLRPLLEKRLKQDMNDWEIFRLDMKLYPCLVQMAIDGMQIDPKVLQKSKQICEEEITKSQYEVAGYLGEHVNLNSPVQLAAALFDSLGLPVTGVTDTGTPSTDFESLKALEKDHPTIPPLIRYKEHTKLLGTYIDPILSMLDKNNRLHGQLHQCVTVTGRLSSSEPNLQNMPVKSKVGKTIRNAFVSRFKGGKLIVADQSQFELRLLAHMADEPLMIKAFQNKNVDYHQIKADELGISRSAGKTLNFAIVYNVGYEQLAYKLKQSEAQAQEYLVKQAAVYKAVTKWKEGQAKLGEEKGYVKTILGRKCYIDHRKYVGTTSSNYPIQGSAGDLMKIAMIQIADHIKKMGYEAVLVNQVHDELIIDAPTHEVSLLIPYIREKMENPEWDGKKIEMRCPLEADIKVVDNWGEAKD